MSFLSYPKTVEKEVSVSSYLEIVEKAKREKPEDEVRSSHSVSSDRSPTTKTTETTKAPDTRPVRDTSPKRPPNFTPLTVSEALAGINAPGTGAGKNAELYRRGELYEEKAIEYVTCAILYRRGESFEVWKHHAPAVRKALSLCLHELEPEKCNVCNGHVKRLIEEGGT
jgi:hypothetical protein